jgi:hypothetical protein
MFRQCLVNQRLQMSLMSVKAEFAVRMIYLVCTFLLKASAASHVEQKDLRLKKRLLG